MTSQYEFPTTNSVAEASVDYRFANTNKGFEDEVYEPVSCSQVPTSAGQQVKPSLPEPNPLKPTKKPKEDAFRFKWILIVVAIAVVVNTALAAAALGIAVQAGDKIDQVQNEVGDIKSADSLDSRLDQVTENPDSANIEIWQRLIYELERNVTLEVKQIRNQQSALNSRLGDITENFDSANMEIWQRLKNVPIRLVDGFAASRGRIEIFHDGLWGTICDDIIDYDAGDVICRLLGYNYAPSVRGNAYYGAGTGPIWLNNLSCFGNETTLEDCAHNGWGVHNCGHSEDLSVVCV